MFGLLGEVSRPTGSLYAPPFPAGRRTSWPIFPQTDVPALIHGPQGETYLNPVKDAQKWFYRAALSTGDTFATVVGANGTAQLVIQADAEENLRGDFELVKLMATSTGRFSVEIVSPTVDRVFSNAPVADRLVFGTSQLPAVLFETVLIEATTSLILRVTDLSGAPNTVRIVAAGRRFLDWGRGIDRQAMLGSFYRKKTHAFWLTLDNGAQVALGPGATATFSATVLGSADFEAWTFMDDSDGTYDIQVFEGRSARALMNQPLPAQAFVASPSPAVAGMPTGVVKAASLPFAYTFTHLFKRSTRVRVTVTDTSGAPNQIRLAWHGRLIYYDEAPGVVAPTPQRAGAVGPILAPVYEPRRATGPGPGQVIPG